MSHTPTRRRFLAIAGLSLAGSLAGCTTDSEETGTLTIEVNNQSGTTQAVTVRVTDSDGDRRVDTTETVPADVSRSFQSADYEDGQYGIQVQGDDWATSSVWRPSECRDYRFRTRLGTTEETPMVTAESTCPEQ